MESSVNNLTVETVNCVKHKNGEVSPFLQYYNVQNAHCNTHGNSAYLFMKYSPIRHIRVPSALVKVIGSLKNV